MLPSDITDLPATLLEDGLDYTLQFFLPAGKLLKLAVSICDDNLIVDAEAEYHEDERESFRGTVSLPGNVRKEAFLPKLEDGFLRVTLDRL